MMNQETTLKLLLGLAPEHTPFPWQERLLERFMKGELPNALDLPTGLGKTKTIAIWLAARALGAPVPTRLVYVVDRRAVVDQATKEAEELRALIAATPELQEALGLETELAISTLRGQFADNRQWQADPSAPAIIVGTVDMIGSKLLFQGYATSRKMRPYQAGLLGIDSLFVIDESHLVPPFEHMLRQAATLQRGYIDTPLFTPTRVLALSATGSGGEQVFRLNVSDHEHPIVQQRLLGEKRLELLPASDELAESLADQAWAIAYPPAPAVESEQDEEQDEEQDGAPPTPDVPDAWPKIIVFCNSRKTAQAVHSMLEKRGKSKDHNAALPQLDLLVGARRAWEREHKNRLTELGFLAGAQVELQGPAFLICTSAGEVGVDLDADHMVADLVEWERMVQRLGRVNRRGEGCARVIIVPDSGKSKAEDIERITRLRAPLEHLPKLSLEPLSYDASISALVGLKDQPDARIAAQAAGTPEPFYPPLTRAVVEDWAMTILEDHAGRPAPAPWLRGWLKEDPPQLTLVWRTHMPHRASSKEEKKEIDAFFQAAYPHPSEQLNVPAYQALDWLLARAKAFKRANPDKLGSILGVLLARDRSFERTYTLGQWLDASAGGPKAGLLRALSGKTLVLCAELGGLSSGLLDPKQKLCAETADKSDAELSWRLPFQVRLVRAPTPSDAPPDTGTKAVKGSKLELCHLTTERGPDGTPREWLAVRRVPKQAPKTEAGRASGPIQTLDEHQQWTQVQAERLADRLGLKERWRTVLTRAALWHDAGKAAERWQRAFGRPPELKDRAYAKLGGPIRFSVLAGYRHELGSILRIQHSKLLDDLDEQQTALLLHLVIAHHGRGRPMVPIDSCDYAPPSVLRVEQQAVAMRYAKLQKQWGPWGLAWWEGLLRASDVRASILNDQREKETT